MIIQTMKAKLKDNPASKNKNIINPIKTR